MKREFGLEINLALRRIQTQYTIGKVVSAIGTKFREICKGQ